MTQGNPLLLTIFNLVVDAVICHWESLMVAEREVGKSSGDKGNRAQQRGGRSGTKMTEINERKRVTNG